MMESFCKIWKRCKKNIGPLQDSINCWHNTNILVIAIKLQIPLISNIDSKLTHKELFLFYLPIENRNGNNFSPFP